MAKKRSRKAQPAEDGPVPVAEPIAAVLEQVQDQAEPPVAEVMDPEAERREEEKRALMSVEAEQLARQARKAKELSEQIAAVQLAAREEPSPVMTPAAPAQEQAPEQTNGQGPREVHHAAEQSKDRKLSPSIDIVLGGDNVLHAGVVFSRKTEKHYSWLRTDKPMDRASREELAENDYKHGPNHIWWKELNADDRWKSELAERAFLQQLGTKIREGFGLGPATVMGVSQ